MNYKAVIFDFDGLMVDTEPIYYEAMQEMAIKRKKKFTLEIKKEVMGTGGIISMRIMKERLKLKEAPEELLEERAKIFASLLYTRGVKPMPGLFHAINIVDKLGMKKAIASSSRVNWINFSLEKLGLKNAFDVIVASEEVNEGKPSPEIFNITVKRLGVKKENCIVIEDTVVGVNAAKKANIKCIVVPNQYNKDMDFSQADIVLNSLEELNEEIIKKLIWK